LTARLREASGKAIFNGSENEILDAIYFEVAAIASEGAFSAEIAGINIIFQMAHQTNIIDDKNRVD